MAADGGGQAAKETPAMTSAKAKIPKKTPAVRKSKTPALKPAPEVAMHMQ